MWLCEQFNEEPLRAFDWYETIWRFERVLYFIWAIYIELLFYLFSGVRVNEFPKDLAEQNAKAVEAVRDIVKRVLGRDEPFSLVVRKSNQRRYVKDTSLVIIPPVEVSFF